MKIKYTNYDLNIIKNININNISYLNNIPIKTERITFINNLYTFININSIICDDLYHYINLLELDILNNKIKYPLNTLNKKIKYHFDNNNIDIDFINKCYKELADITQEKVLNYDILVDNIINKKFNIILNSNVNNCYIFNKSKNYYPTKNGKFIDIQLFKDSVYNNYTTFDNLKLEDINNFYISNNIGKLYYPKDFLEPYLIVFKNNKVDIYNATYEDLILCYLYELAKNSKLENSIICIDSFYNKSTYIEDLLNLFIKKFNCYFIIN